MKFCEDILGNGTSRPEPWKVMTVEKWEILRTVSAMRAFLGFTNYYISYIKGYAEIFADLQEKLKVSREEGKKETRCR